MPKEIAHFQNFAKLKDTKVEFNDITVLAGKPSTGKSYVMKFMYAVEEAFHSIGLDLLIQEKTLYDIDIQFQKLEEMYDKIKNNTTTDSTTISEQFEQELHEVQLALKRQKNLFKHDISKVDNDQDRCLLISTELRIRLNNLLNSIFLKLEQISKFNVKTQFLTVDNATELIVTVNTKNKKDISNGVFFVETPLILEFKKFMNRREGKTPYHIESLLNILDTDYSFTDEEQDKFIKSFTQKSKAIINGNVESSGDSFVFKTATKDYDILNASSGIKSIGLLQYLVTNKALKKDSILFWEEPEVHLHPKWQLKMVDLFVELMNAGVKIVFSTHSPYMADYLNAKAKKEGFRDRVSFNLLEESAGVVVNHILQTQQDWNKIQTELLDPLEEIMWEYV
ncbi:MAG: ATP-binding protein [Campylobacterales bacterium]|nr:ATP-binding protein [Campylobacterales bacterium]